MVSTERAYPESARTKADQSLLFVPLHCRPEITVNELVGIQEVYLKCKSDNDPEILCCAQNMSGVPCLALMIIPANEPLSVTSPIGLVFPWHQSDCQQKHNPLIFYPRIPRYPGSGSE
jgi:hypothetical protein